VRVLLFLLVVFLVNLPVVNESWNEHQVASEGHEVGAIVLDTREINDRFLVDYRLPEAEDPQGTKFSASVDAETFRYAESSDRLAVRVIKGKPGTNRPDGLVESSLFKVIAIAGDIVLALILVLSWYRRRNPGDMPDPRPKPVGL